MITPTLTSRMRKAAIAVFLTPYTQIIHAQPIFINRRILVAGAFGTPDTRGTALCASTAIDEGMIRSNDDFSFSTRIYIHRQFPETCTPRKVVSWDRHILCDMVIVVAVQRTTRNGGYVDKRVDANRSAFPGPACITQSRAVPASRILKLTIIAESGACFRLFDIQHEFASQAPNKTLFIIGVLHAEHDPYAH